MPDMCDYESRWAAKVERGCALLGTAAPQLFPSPPVHHRQRAEFQIGWRGGRPQYCMTDSASGRLHEVREFPTACRLICDAMPGLLDACRAQSVLGAGLFQINFLASRTPGQLLATLIYRRPLQPGWQDAADGVCKSLGLVGLLGRSRRRLAVCGQDHVEERFSVAGREYSYRHLPGCFSQPNAAINEQMLGWAHHNLGRLDGDLLELYSGIGNFSLPLASRARRVLATENNRASLRALQCNLRHNAIDNVDCARLSAAETAQALAGVRPFRRMAHLRPDGYDFGCLLVDPPRCGLDEPSRRLAAQMRRIVYFSCNPRSMAADLAALPGHRLVRVAFFDQFPGTDHLEVGALLEAV